MDGEARTYYHRHLAVTDSTNRYARDKADAMWQYAGNAEALVVTADEQTAGRGQRGNVWRAAAGENILASIVLRPSFVDVRRQFSLSQACALAIRDAMADYGIAVRLKWPNDIYVGNGKLAGILVEVDFSVDRVEQCILGVGLNVNQTEFPVMERVPVSMRLLGGVRYDVVEVLDVVMEKLLRYVALLRDGRCDVLDEEYKHSLIGMGEERRYADASGCFRAVIDDVRPNGYLVLRRTDGAVSEYAFKEVEQFFD